MYYRVVPRANRKGNTMRVWVVYFDSMDETFVEGVYSTEEKAWQVFCKLAADRFGIDRDSIDLGLASTPWGFWWVHGTSSITCQTVIVDE